MWWMSKEINEKISTWVVSVVRILSRYRMYRWFFCNFFVFVFSSSLSSSTDKTVHSSNSIHSQNNEFTCYTCAKSYKYKRSLDRHLQLECGKIPQFACPYCSYHAKQRIHLKSHVQIRHGAVLPLWNFCWLFINIKLKFIRFFLRF